MPNKDKDKKMVVGVVWNCGTELKFLLVALIIFCTIAGILQFIPLRAFFHTSDLRRCITISRDSLGRSNVSAGSGAENSGRSNLSAEPSAQAVKKRVFIPYGAAAYNYIMMSAYRGGPSTFAVVGLASKPLHLFGRPAYRCEWLPRVNTSEISSVDGRKIMPDWGYGRVYTVVVINCTFSTSVGVDGSGGELIIYASNSGGGDRSFVVTDRIPAFHEEPGSVSLAAFDAPPKYEYLYCGSSLYGNLSPQRIREWMAYHARLFGGRSHFVIYDAGGVHPEVMAVLRPWIDLGYVTLHDIREQKRFDGYYHNQFLIVNDCLHRYKFDARWIFFFDVDEYIYVPAKRNLRSVLKSMSSYSQFTIEQVPMAKNICLADDSRQFWRKWGFEKLVYRNVQRGIRRDRKYAVQPRRVYATGVHMSQDLDGKTSHDTEGMINYFHYHGTVSERREPCRIIVNGSRLTSGGLPYALDVTMRSVAPAVKRFEFKTVGSRLPRTRQ